MSDMTATQPAPRALSMKDNRAMRNRALAADARRTRLKVTAFIRELDDIERELRDINAQVTTSIPLFDAQGAPIMGADGKQLTIANALSESQARAYAVRLATLKQRTDINFRKLAKVMPDLKAVQLSDPNGQSPFQPLADALREAAANSRLPALEHDRVIGD